MKLEDYGLIFAIVANIATVIGVLVVYMKSKETMSARFAKIEFIALTLWDFHLRRAGGEMVMKEYGTLNSPLEIKPEVLKWYDSLARELRSFYSRLGRHDMTDRELAIMIEHNFGGKMLKEICIPHGMSQGECLLIATAVAKGSHTVEIPDVHLSQEEASRIARAAGFGLPKDGKA